MLKEKISIYLPVILIILFSTVCCARAAEQYEVQVLDAEPSENLEKEIENIFSKATEFTTKYIPRGNTGSRVNGVSRLENGWKYKLSFRCPLSCKGSGVEFQKFLMTGLRQDKACPFPFTASLDFQVSGATFSKIYFHESGHCFQFGLDGDAFYTHESFWDVKNDFWKDRMN